MVFFSVSMSLDGFIAPSPSRTWWGSSGWNCRRGWSRSWFSREHLKLAEETAAKVGVKVEDKQKGPASREGKSP